MKLLLTACFCFLLLINGAPVECRRHREPEQHKDKMLFVFGDSYVDAGGRPRTSERSRMSRPWYHPYGLSDKTHHNRATGRFSDGLVQSDFLAKILGSDESPLPYRTIQTESRGKVHRSGVNFAIAGSGVFDGDGTSLRGQIDQMVSMVDDGIIEERDLKDSVALIAICAGEDYNQISKDSTTYGMVARTRQVTDEIAAAVKRLQDVGVGKVLVNLVPPMGCNPWQSAPNNYTSCEEHGNVLASMHNSALREKLDKSNNVSLLDLFSVFSSLETANLVPCCYNKHEADGYCGQVDNNGRAMYSVCDNPEDAFFWDYMHPTQSAWEDIMERLTGRIEDFLGIESSW